MRRNSALRISFVIVLQNRAPAKDLLGRGDTTEQSCRLSLLKWHKAKFALTSLFLVKDTTPNKVKII